MIENKRLLALSLAVATSLTACGGGDADQNVVRNLFAVGDIVEGIEDGDPVEDDVSKNDVGEGLTFSLADGSDAENGTLVFNTDGSFIYTPNPDFYGTDSVTYVATQSSTGETDTALLTFDIANDFESLDEYGWNLAWSDEFDSTELDESIWTGVNASVADGMLVITAEEGITSSLKAVNGLSSGRIEASIQIPEGGDLSSVFGLFPMADIYEGENALTAMRADAEGMIAGAHYGLGLINGVNFHSDSVAGAKAEFHSYAIEWGADQIRWYFDGVHIHTVDTLNTWAYTLNGDDVVADNAGPFNQDMKIVLELAAEGVEPIAALLVDYIKVFSCDPLIETSVEDCASYVNKTIAKAASDRVETVGPVITEIFNDGYVDKDDVKVSDLEPLTWHYTDEIIELSFGNWNSPTIEVISTEGEHDLVIDVSHPEGAANMGISAPGVELVGRDAVLNFDMYIDSANTLSETLDIRIETGWPYMGVLTWNVADLELDTWVTYSIPVSDFVNNPFINGEGEITALDTSNIGSFLTVEFQDGVHFQLDNIQLSCTSNESCIQGPLAIQEESGADVPSTVYQAENFDTQSGLELEDSADDGGGQNIGFADPGDFLEYTITAPVDGAYSIDYRLASESGSEGFELSIDGIVVDTVALEPTGGWQSWITQSGAAFDLTAGDHMIRIDFIGGAININWFEIFEPVSEIHIEAEDFDTQSGLELEDAADDGGGQNIGFADPGDFLEYTVNIPADGTYTFEYRLASESGSEGFEVSFDGTVVDTVALEPTGGWQSWISQTSTVDLVAGEQTLRLDFVGGAININWIKITN